jgi:SAM-dependent methyltransferase
VKARLVDMLACPECGGSLSLRDSAIDDGGEIVTGELACRSCSRTYGVRGGIPRLLPQSLSVAEEKTSAAFGWQWREFVEMYDQYEAQFLDWIYPLQPEFFRNKLVLDAGCGNGRHAQYAAGYGARDVVAMDFSQAVETAYENIGKMPNVHVIQGDINHPPFKRAVQGGPFDFIYSIGVLHHMPEPEAGFASLVRFVQPGGAIFAWVYGRENNGVVHNFINPLRKGVTSKLPPRTLPVIAWPMAAVLQGLVKGVYRPLHGTRIYRRLPLHEYLYSLSTFGFRRNYNIVFDHLVAPVAFYIPRDEFEAWFTRHGLSDVQITWRNENSWRGFGRVSEEQQLRRAQTS